VACERVKKTFKERKITVAPNQLSSGYHEEERWQEMKWREENCDMTSDDCRRWTLYVVGRFHPFTGHEGP